MPRLGAPGVPIRAPRPAPPTRISPTTGSEALEARLSEIAELAGKGDPAFQPGSAFFGTRLGAAVESAISGGEGDPFLDALLAAQSAVGSAGGGAADNSMAIAELQAELERERLAEEKRQFDITMGLEAAGLATGPTGAIQLAFLARGQGAPNEQIKSMFQNLPFVQALLGDKGLPGFGLPEQFGGASARTGTAPAPGVPVPGGGIPGVNMTLDPQYSGAGALGGRTTTGGTFGLTLPSKTGITEAAFTGLSDFEKEFLGALGQAETGQGAEGFLADIVKSFIPTTGRRTLGVG